MATFAFQQVDVFTAVPLRGNPLAVVRDADALTDVQMAAFARWTNLSETTYLLRPTAAGADYRVRLAFAAPPLRRSGPAEPDVVARLARGLRLDPGAIRAAQWVDNGPGWV